MSNQQEAAGERRFLVRHSVWVLLQQAGLVILNIVRGKLVAVFLGPAGKGVVALATLLPGFIAGFGDIGVGQSATIVVARARRSAREVLGVTTLWALLLGVVYFVAIILLFPCLSQNILKGVDLDLLVIAFLMVPFLLCFLFTKNILRGLKAFKAYNLTSLSRQVAEVALIVPFLVVLGWGAAGVLVAVLIASIIAALLTWSTVRRHTGAPAVSPTAFRSLMRFGGPLWLVSVFGKLNWQLDTLIVNYFLDPYQVGLFVTAVSLSNYLNRVPEAVGTVLLPVVASGTDRQRSADSTAFVSRNVLFVGGLAAVGLAVVGRPLLHLLFSHEFVAAYQPLLVLLPGYVILSLNRLLGSALAGMGELRLLLYATIAGMTTNLILDLVLIPRSGIMGAAWASTVSYCLGTAVMSVSYLRVTGSSVREVVLVRSDDLVGYGKLIKKALQRIRRVAGAHSAGS